MNHPPSDWQAQLADNLRSAGAALVGFADLTGLPADVRHGFPRAVSIAVALEPTVVKALTAGPTRDYLACPWTQKYLRRATAHPNQQGAIVGDLEV